MRETADSAAASNLSMEPQDLAIKMLERLNRHDDVRSLIRDLLFEVRVLTRINPELAMRAERDLLELAGVR